jgi:hypothetical protein
MKRNFNYTKRKKIDRMRVHAQLAYGQDGERSFAATVNLQGLNLQPAARVFVEAYVQRSLMRFDFGTVAAVGPSEPTLLTEIDPSAQVFFRVKVVDRSTGRGLVLAVADGIVPLDPATAPTSRVPLLDVVYADDMGQQLWAVDYNEASGPYLKVNARIPDAKQFMKLPSVRALVLPAILREVLSYIAFVRGSALSDDDMDTWSGRWLTMVRMWHRGEVPVRDGDAEDDWNASAKDWIDQAVSTFADRLAVLGLYCHGPEEEIA